MLHQLGKIDSTLFFIKIKIGSIMCFEHIVQKTGIKGMRDGTITHQKLSLHFTLSLMFVVYTKNRALVIVKNSGCFSFNA